MLDLPDLAQQLFAREHATWIGHQRSEKLELERAQREQLVIAAYLVRDGIEREGPGSEPRNRRRCSLSRGRTLADAARQRAHAKHDLLDVEWLDYVVIRAGFETDDAILART